ncbi:uncharacterized protein UPF0180 [Melghirimyces profundicolus]|uniref:Uncharacterized protein UPF0180 n=1 Tax=Melghirimyces profundicolus TaxID=1242148 RepID=A0A2T6C9Q4_9BACL|nr:YkuS family protein [Melghirimyces profundicolus]PTX65032.1 uncharacterized protein UPF0180 [Melghirimyces profundicolus]
MNARVAVEDGLQPVSQYLQIQGCQVVKLDEGSAQNCDCCVISGGDKDMMGMQDTIGEMQVINAEGMTPEEVYQAVQRGMNQQNNQQNLQ